MAGSTNLPRRYDDDEVARLLKRATELHEDEPARVSRGGGLTLKELEEIAVEAGINPAYLRRAARELDEPTSPGAARSKQLLGEDTTLLYERVISGEIPDEAFEDLVAVLQSSSLDYGQPSLLGRTLTWRAETPSKTRAIQVVVTSRDGETHIRVEERLHQLAGGLFGGVTAGVGLGVGMGVGLPVGIVTLGSPLFAVAFPVSVIGLSFLGAREIYRGLVSGRRRVLSELTERLAQRVTAAVASKREALPPAQ